jgi:hypothetical protein
MRSHTSTSTKELPSITEKTSTGIYHTKSEDIIIIERFILAALAPLRNLVKKIQTWKNPNTITVKEKIPSEWTAFLQKQLNSYLKYSTTSPVILVPLVPHPLHYQEVLTHPPQKLVRFLHHLYPRESNPPHLLREPRHQDYPTPHKHRVHPNPHRHKYHPPPAACLYPHDHQPGEW